MKRHFLLFYDYVPDIIERRAPFRQAHVAEAAAAADRGELLVAGALAEPVDQAVFLFLCEDVAVIERFVAADPYVRNDLVTGWRIRPWTTVVGPLAANPIA